jgi:hypothetical protein
MLGFSVLKEDLDRSVVEAPDFVVADENPYSDWGFAYRRVIRRQRIKRAWGEAVIIRSRNSTNQLRKIDLVALAAAKPALSSSEIMEIAGSAVMASVARALANTPDIVKESSAEQESSTPEYAIFTPGPALTAFWLRGVSDHLREMRISSEYRSRFETLVDLSPEQVKKEFAIRLQRIFATIGNRQRYGIEDVYPLATSRRFSLTFQHHLLDRLPIRPDENTEFFSLLFSELESFFTSGRTVGGSWGKIIFQHGSIFMEFTERKSVTKIPGRQRAKVLE